MYDEENEEEFKDAVPVIVREVFETLVWVGGTNDSNEALSCVEDAAPDSDFYLNGNYNSEYKVYLPEHLGDFEFDPEVDAINLVVEKTEKDISDMSDVAQNAINAQVQKEGDVAEKEVER